MSTNDMMSIIASGRSEYFAAAAAANAMRRRRTDGRTELFRAQSSVQTVEPNDPLRS